MVTAGEIRQGVAPGEVVVASVDGMKTGQHGENGENGDNGVTVPQVQDKGNDIGENKAVETTETVVAPPTAAGRQLKELRSLMPWNWDARIEDHPPGEKAMMDFEDVVNYRYDGRRRGRSMSAVEQVERFKRAEEAKAEREKKRMARLERAAKNKDGVVGNGKNQKTNGDKKGGTKASGEQKPKPKVEAKVEARSLSRPPKKTSAKKAVASKKRVVCGEQDRAGGAVCEDLESNKENVPPTLDLGKEAQQIDASAAVTPAVAKSRRNVPRSCTKEQAVTTPGFVLTPVTDNPPTVSARKRSKSSKVENGLDRISPANKYSKRLTGERQKPQAKSRRVTFGKSAGDATQLAPPTANTKVSSTRAKKTPRADNFPESLTIDLDKYGYGIGVRPPPGCPPLFRTMNNHGRTTVPEVSPLTTFGMLQTPTPSLNDSLVSRICTPYQGKPGLSREFILAQMVQVGLQAAAELEQISKAKGKGQEYAAFPAVAGSSATLEFSPQLTAALAMLSEGRAAHL